MLFSEENCEKNNNKVFRRGLGKCSFQMRIGKNLVFRRGVGKMWFSEEDWGKCSF